jgi:capsular polysaccharide biosynthesis protein
MEPSGSCSEDICAGARKVRESGSRADNTGVRFSHSLLGRWLPVVALTAVGAAAAAGFAYTAADQYRATAQLIVSPVSASDPTYLGLGLLRDTGGKRTAAASAAVLLRSAQVADAVRTELGLTRSRDSLLAALHAHAVGSSDVVDVTVQDTSAVRAAQLANAFANAVVSQRTASFQSQLTTAIRRAQQQLLALPPNQRTIGAGALLQQRLTVLRSLQGQPDPTIRPAAQAEAPTAAIGPRRPLLVGIGAGAGFLVGLLVVAFLALTRRRPRDEALRKDVSARSVDLRAAQPVAVVPSPDLKRREQELEERAEALAAREQRTDVKADELERRTAELEERAEVLERRTAELETRTETRAADVGAREAEAREAAALETATLEAEARAAEARAREAEARAAEAQAREAAERAAAKRAAAEREAADHEAAERAAAEREAAERAAREREAAEREAAERAAAERAAADHAAAEREAAERAARERAAREREAAEREAAEREAAEREAAERAAALRVAEERAAAERAAADRAAAERAAKEQEDAAQEAAARAAAAAARLPEPAFTGVPLYRADAAPANGSTRGHWNLTELERLVEERGREFPERIDEWESYLFFLRDYAEPDGSVPASFDWLIEDEFAELV